VSVVARRLRNLWRWLFPRHVIDITDRDEAIVIVGRRKEHVVRIDGHWRYRDDPDAHEAHVGWRLSRRLDREHRKRYGEMARARVVGDKET
jgi:hypothetical protein